MFTASFVIFSEKIITIISLCNIKIIKKMSLLRVQHITIAGADIINYDNLTPVHLI